MIVPSHQYLIDRVHMTRGGIGSLEDPPLIADSDIGRTNIGDNVILDQSFGDLSQRGYLPDSIVNDMELYTALLLSASMGAGKTHQQYKFLQKHPGKSVLFVGFRVILNAKYLRELGHMGFRSYSESDIPWIIHSESYPHFICQINSLGRMRGKYDIIVIDEVSYATDMIFHFIGDQAQFVMSALTQHIKKCEHVLFMDALLGQAHKDFLVALMRERAMKL